MGCEACNNLLDEKKYSIEIKSSFRNSKINDKFINDKEIIYSKNTESNNNKNLNDKTESNKEEIKKNIIEINKNDNTKNIPHDPQDNKIDIQNIIEFKNVNDDKSEIVCPINKDEYETIMTISSKIFTDSDFTNNSINLDKDEIISLGINIGSFRTVYSVFKKINGKYISHVFLMNNSSRIIPSILCFTKTHRLFGENSKASLKQNLDSSFFNLSRIIGFNNDIKFYEKEIGFEYNSTNDFKNHKFYSKNLNGKKEIESEEIIANYLGLINKYFFILEKKEYTSTYLSLPDYYTSYQKETLKLICKSLHMKDIHIVNESSSITMYYGYTKYRDNFVINKNNVDSTIIKNILFIDSGHSKTNFILSSFKYDTFKVKYVLCLPNLGGRNFDEKIFEYCKNEFIRIKNIDKTKFELTPKMKYKLNEAIQKSRIQLTTNKESTITVDIFYNNEDLNINLTRSNFEQLIKENINEIKVNLLKVIQYSKENNIKIDYAEIVGELMRTPILQQIVEENKIQISKSLLIDECTSVGAALIGNFIKGKLPIANYNKFYHYNYYKIEYQIFTFNNFQTKKNVLFDIGIIENNEMLIELKKEYSKKDKPIRIKFFYNKDVNNNNIQYFINDLNLIEYEIDLFNVFEENKIILQNNCPYFKIKLDESQKLTDEEIVFDNNRLKGEIKSIKNGIYKLNKEKNEIIKKIYEVMKSNKNYDLNYHNFVEKKNQLSKLIYDLKDKIEKNDEIRDELNNIISLDKKINRIKDIEKDDSMSNLEKELKKISLNIIEKLLKGNNNNLSEKLNKMKNELSKAPNNFEINELIEIL